MGASHTGDNMTRNPRDTTGELTVDVILESRACDMCDKEIHETLDLCEECKRERDGIK